MTRDRARIDARNHPWTRESLAAYLADMTPVIVFGQRVDETDPMYQAAFRSEAIRIYATFADRD